MPSEVRIFRSSGNTRLPGGCEGFTTYCRERKVREFCCVLLWGEGKEKAGETLASDVSANARLPCIGIFCPEPHGRAQKD